jgi:hypothetical protein
MKRKIILISILNLLIVGCTDSCDEDTECGYIACLKAKQEMINQGRKVGFTMQCTHPDKL